MNNEKINARQFLVLVTLFTIGTTILVVPSGLAAEGKQDAWIVAIVGTVMGLLVIWIYNTIALRFPNMTFIDINEKIFGKWLGKTVSLLFVSMPLLYTSILFIYNGNFLATQMMPDTPIPAFTMLMVIILVMGVRLGLETIGRSAEIFIVFFFVLFIILVVFITPQIKFENIQPVFEVDIKTILRASLYLIVTSSVNSVILLMIFPALVNQPKEAKKSFYIGNIIGGLVIIIITVLCILVLGADNTARQTYPSFILAREINVGNFVQRIEGTIAIMWFITIYFKMTLYFYASVLGIAQIFNLKHYRPLILPLGMVLAVLSNTMYENVVKQQDFDVKVTIPHSLIIGLFLPLIMLVVSVFQKETIEEKE
ncbi:GerAB/ArcD/ProY family transporter [Neobacillus drentensis]|uniref:GerAB/ArcD/ProY family transporter n=1 Tax=Neobacillus drentensis TaxID=220684 RepID=UPI0030001A04